MAFDLQEFVNREAEINAFASLLDHRRQRILLLHGPAGIGKSCVAHRLRRDCRNLQIVSTLVDFRSDRMLSRADRVIQRLREHIGGAFADQLGQAEAQIQRDLATAPASVSPGPAEAIVGALSSLGRGGGGGVSLSGEVEVGGDVVGRDKIVIKNSTIVLNPGGGLDFASAEAEARRNAAFRTALTDLQARQRVVLFFDHFEEATEEVASWVRHHVLGLHLEEAAEFPNLWIVVTGRRVPFQDEVDQWRHVLRSRLIGPLSDEAIYLFWVDKRGLDPAHVSVIVPASGGNPQLLFLMANNFAKALGREQADE